MIAAGTLLSAVSQADLAFASLSSVSRTSVVHNIGSARWSISVANTAQAIPDGTGNGLAITPTNLRQTCTTNVTKNTTAVVSGGTSRVLTFSNVTGLSNGMTVTGQGIVNPGVTTITSRSLPNNTVTLSDGPETTSVGAAITFSSGCTNTYDSFIYLNNTGDIDISKVTFSQVVTTTSSYTMSIRSCNVGGVGTAIAAWTIPAVPATPTCAGTINTILASVVSGGTATPTTVASYSIPIPAGTSIQLRVLSSFATSATKTTTISVSVITSDLRASTNTNG